MIVVFGGDSGDVSPLPADILPQVEGAEAVVILDPLAFPFEALRASGGPPMVLRFSDAAPDAPDEIWAQLGEVVLTKLAADEIVIAPDDVVTMLGDTPSFGATTGRSTDHGPAEAAALASGIDRAAVQRERAIRQEVATVLSAAMSDVPSRREPLVAWADGGFGYLAHELADASVATDHHVVDIGLLSAVLAGRSDADQRTTIAAMWEFVRPGGSLVVVDELAGSAETARPLQTIPLQTDPLQTVPVQGLSVDGLLDNIATVSNHQATLADVVTIATGQSVVVRVRKLGRAPALPSAETPRNSQPVFVVANDVVPGLGMPAAAPGLRATGFVTGLRSNDVGAMLITPVGNRPSPWRSEMPAPSHADSVVVRPVDLRAFLESRAPATVVITNSNVIESVRDIEGVDVVFDLFAPKVLELECSVPAASDDTIDRLRQRKMSALQVASAYVVNGDKKRPYLDRWLHESGIDPEAAAIVGAKMAVPGNFSGIDATSPTSPGPLRLAMTGYLQRWSRPGAWLHELVARLDANMVLTTVLASHWGERNAAATSGFAPFDTNPWVRQIPAMEFEAFADFLARQHVVIDLFDKSAERELAMVTRTVVALASGTPVVHPPFTEVSPLIAEYEAGWLIDPADLRGIAELLDHLADHRDEVAHRTVNARKLWIDHFEPKAATADMARLLLELESQRVSA